MYNKRRRHYVLRSCMRPSVNTYCAWHDIHSLSGWISVKHATYIQEMSAAE